MALNNTYFEAKGRDVTVPIPDTPGYVPPSPPTPPSPDPGSVPVIPRPTFSGEVTCVLYVNSSENNKLDKDLSTTLTTTLAIKEDVDVVHPEVVVKSATDLTGINYMKLGNRYYYAHAVMMPGGDLYKITGNSDVLMTFKDQIRQQTAVIGRNQNNYNRFLNDNRIKLNAYEQVKTLEFSSGFSKTMQYYLVTIGGASS